MALSRALTSDKAVDPAKLLLLNKRRVEQTVILKTKTKVTRPRPNLMVSSVAHVQPFH